MKQLLIFTTIILSLFYVNFSALAYTGIFESIEEVLTDCSIGQRFSLSINVDFMGDTFDTVTTDYIAFILYDAYGTVISFMSIAGSAGYRASFIGIYFRLTSNPAARPFTLVVHDTTRMTTLADAQTAPLVDSISFDPADYGDFCTDLPDLEPDAIPLERENVIENPSFSDGRLNNYDMAAPVVAYGHDFENGRGLVVYSPEGALLLEVHPEVIAAVAECPEENTLIASSGNVALYRLTSCDFQLNAPSLDGSKTYVLIFDSLYNTGYISYEE